MSLSDGRKGESRAVIKLGGSEWVANSFYLRAEL